MPDPIELMLSDLTARYADAPTSDAYTRLYVDAPQFGAVFASLHERLNDHFRSINDRAKSTLHYWADSSRQMLGLIDEVAEVLGVLQRASVTVTFASAYRDAIERCKPWLRSSGGSPVPEDFELIELLRYEPVFTLPDTAITLVKQRLAVPTILVGAGSYATVHCFTDPDYGIKIAIKRAKKNLDLRDLERFRHEFDVLSRLSFPYIVAVYAYDANRNEYTMEFCDETLRQYIEKRNRTLSFNARKRIALQFLYGINYLHFKNLLHRDVSLQNALVKVFDDGAVLVKLSDLGNVKDPEWKYTRTHTQMRGTILDPTLSSFREYGVANEIYSLGWVLSYIFTGKEALTTAQDHVSRIVAKCTAADPRLRYENVRDLITEVERIDAAPTGTPA